MRRRHAWILLGMLVAALSLTGSAPVGAATIAYPDLQVLVPPADISVGQLSPTTRVLEFTHITWDAGAGPLEIRPVYNPVTGISQGVQALYTSPSPGVWTFDHTVPIVGPMIWDPPSDYRFPLDTFALYKVAPSGGLGALVATSPKVDFCMTADTFVGGVPNTPSTNNYSGGACASPEGTLGLPVGWGDQYDSTDGGENIDISSVPNGAYWLRAEVDPYHYLLESSTSNNITDTKLGIEGGTATVLAQTHPDSTPPAVVLTSPAASSVVSGTVALSATASGPAPVSSVQFLLDGQPLGAPVTAPPYTTSWTVGSTPPGAHYLSVRATDANGLIGTASAVPVTVASHIGSVAIDAEVNQIGRTTTTTPSFSTSSAGDVLLAFAGSDGPSATQSLTVTGAGLTWKLVKRANAQPGDAEIWTATAPTALANVTVRAADVAAGYDQSLTVVALQGASGVGSSAVTGALNGAPAVSLTATQAGSVDFATGQDWDNDIARTLGLEQSLLAQYLDTQTGDTYWTQYATAPTAAAGQKVMLSDTSPTGDRWNFAAVEVLPGTSSTPPDTVPPTVSITNPLAGQTVSGTAPVSANASDNVAVGSVQFFLDGKALGAPVTTPPYAVKWDTTTTTNGSHTLTATAIDTSGNVGTATPVKVNVENPSVSGPCFVMDANVTVNGHGAVKTPSFITAEAGEQLLAFVASDGPAGAGKQSTTVSGGGLTWKLVQRANSRSGDAEIWWAPAPAQLTNAAIASTPAVGGYDESLSVVAMQMSNGIGASASAGAASGAPSVSLATVEEGSLVFAVGNDWDTPTPRTLGTNQVMLHQYLDTNTGETFWSQYTGQITGLAGSVVTMNDTAPGGDQWNMAAVELRGDGAGL